MSSRLSRRHFLKLSGLFATWAALSACKPRTAQSPTQPAGANSPTAQQLPTPAAAGDALLLHTLRRLTFGPTPEIIAHARAIGLEAWLEEQLNPGSPDDPAVDDMLARFSTLTMSVAERAELEQRALPVQELTAATLLRQRHSRRQVYEMLVDFWTNHFNIFIGKSQCRILKTDDDLQVIRPNALGKFKDLLWASAHSPAMLVYLDQFESTNEIPNENYARELMELHTISVEAGYSHHDVEEVARALTGWSVSGRRDQRNGLEPGQYFYRARIHDDGEKHVMDLRLPAGGGERDGETILDYLAHHDWTARFISAKLARRFVADDPPPSLVEALAAAFAETEGDIREMMRVLIHSAEFQTSAGGKLKRPLEFFISALRVTGAQLSDKPRPVVEHLRLLGQVPFNWSPPDGYPDYAGWWLTTSGLLNRWNFAMQLTANELRGATVDLETLTADSGSPADVVDALSLRFTGETLPDDARDILVDFASTGDLEKNIAPVAGLILASPHFQIR
jgi:uncharacterized protein (DUF1800 family)